MGGFSRSFQPRNKDRVNDRLKQAPTFSYRANRTSKEDSTGSRRPQTVKPRKLNFRWQHVPTYVVCLLGVVSLFYILSLTTTPRLAIKRPANEQQSILTQPASIYQAEAEKILSFSLLNRSKITIDTVAFNEAMSKKFPEIKTVAVTLPLMGRRPIVEVVIDQPALLYKTTSGQEYLLNEQGEVMRAASEVSGLSGISLPRVNDLAQKKVEPGANAIPGQGVDFITTFIQQLSAKNIKVTETTMPPLASEVQFRMDGVSYFVKASLLNDSRQSAGTFLALKAQLDRESIKPGEYVDVRVEEKAFYK